ncbi:restriction endonuclease [Pseudalkalibacillus berkeleyi]|uniref:Restriction endonuclease n=1 Tax=Pseudalkalibacillus berkeleyi TaxID=1069813 RepID=A0ABS9H224_9BACL|nr:restriction endonuclease [Pseudalkalibacillus berkeleyi]MCF6137872.1 restriction endonuclease [Pseudalkalibacillus berkeleyi]
MNRGYAGFYKGYYLRSSYEYAYAKYLDHHSIQWSYEDDVYDIGYRIYKPDFFFYNKNGVLNKIVEIKSRNEEEKKRARKALRTIGLLNSLEWELISYEELLQLYKVMPISLNSVITEWINSKDTTVNKVAVGKLNGHYNLKHNEKTKREIGNHTKKLWASDSIAKQKMIEGLRKTGLVQKGKLKKPRETRICQLCKRPFNVIVTAQNKFCSRTCSGNVAIKLATETYVNKRKQVHYRIKQYVIQWSKDNKDLILGTPLNKINSTIKPLTDTIQKQYGVKDYRIISKAVFGEDKGRKELLKFMKSVCDEKVC